MQNEPEDSGAIAHDSDSIVPEPLIRPHGPESILVVVSEAPEAVRLLRRLPSATRRTWSYVAAETRHQAPRLFRLLAVALHSLERGVLSALGLLIGVTWLVGKTLQQAGRLFWERGVLSALGLLIGVIWLAGQALRQAKHLSLKQRGVLALGLLIGVLLVSLPLYIAKSHTLAKSTSALGKTIAGAPTYDGAAEVSVNSTLVLGKPTITVAQIEAVLQAYNSPTVGKGQTLYDLGVSYGIDPAFALAFFVHESDAGTRGQAIYTHSLGNIRSLDGEPDYQGYRQYATWEEGMRDWYRLIAEVYVVSGRTTVEQIIPRYAPTSENDVNAYIRSVRAQVIRWRLENLASPPAKLAPAVNLPAQPVRSAPSR